MLNKMFSIAAKVREFIETRTHAPRRTMSLPVSISLAGPSRVQSGPLPPIPALRQRLEGHTCDLSENGLGLILPAIRLGDYYLTDSVLKIRVELSLADETLEMEITPVRYERLENDTGYLVGARIGQMKPAARAVYDSFLQELGAKNNRRQVLTLAPKVSTRAAASLRA